jgi:TonB-linked SusC/RagA family outer membrane protein
MKKFTLLIALRLKACLLLLLPVLLNQTVLANTNDVPGFADIIVKGKVSNKDGPLESATVKVEGAATVAVTDNDGNYTITAPENGFLIFSYSGYKEQRIAINGRHEINVAMLPSVNDMQEVVVVGYRTQTRGTITGSVSSINGAEITDAPYDNLSNALSGRLGGVTVSQLAGTPGMESNIRIRAQGTFNNSSPLYVIDGVVTDKFAFDGLSPSEVESITVLKDAASAAIYGSRAANGVVLVTTRRGREGAPRLNYNGMFAFQKPTQIPETLTAYEHASEINRKLRYIGVSETDPRYYTQDELDYFKTHSWNWVDEMWKDPMTTQHTLDVSGGTKNVRYFLGGSYNYATGSFNNLDYQKLTVRGNVDVSVTRDFKVSLDLSTDDRKTNGPSWQTSNWRQEDLYKALLFRSSMVPPYINGEPVGNWVEWHPGVVTTPSLAGYNKRNWTGLNTTLTLNYTARFIKGLSAKTSINRYKRNAYTKQFNLPYTMTVFNTMGGHSHIVGDSAVGIRPRAADQFLMSREDREERYQFNAQLNYKRNFGLHSIDALAVYEQAEGDDIWFNGRRDNFISSAIDQYVAGSTVGATVDGEQDQSARVSYVGLVSYNYAQKYLLEASFRYDGSVKFAPENRWGFFPSVSAGWRISKEPFFEKVSFINDLKLRASVGLLGNDAVGGWQWLQSFNIVDGAIFDQPTLGLEPGVLANRDLTWEKSLNYNAGFDSRFWQDRMSMKLDWFYRHTYDILRSRQETLPSTLGADLPSENYAVINTRGFEVELGYNSKGASKNRFTYYFTGNFGYAVNKVIKTDEAENIRPYQSQIGYNTGRIFGYVATGILRTQKDLDALPAGYTILGVQPQLGMLNYKDIRGPNSDTPDGKITSDDQQYIARFSDAPMNFGLTFGGAWKSFSVDILLQGVAGGKDMLPTAGRDIQARAEEASFRYWADSWSPENPNGEYPGYRKSGYRTRYDASTFFLVDNSFLRLKNVSLSYSLPQGVIGHAGLRNVRLFFTGTNLLMIYSGNEIYDPEMNNITSYPMMKNFSFGLNIGL